MQVHVLTAEHPTTPPTIIRVFSEESTAERAAHDLVDLLLRDNGSPAMAWGDDWRARLAELQEEHGAEHCYVEITPCEVE